MLSQQELIEVWKGEELQPFTGWDFSYLNGRLLEDPEPWTYTARATELMSSAKAMVDLGTGGGERLLAMLPAWPPKVAATEGYPPNVKLARERLERLGVDVVEVSSDRKTPLPFKDGEFDLVLNRHSGFNSAEIARVLAQGGIFLTQQVDGRWAHDLEALFGAKPQWPDATLENSVEWLTQAGLAIVRSEEWVGKFSFTDVGAVVYYLRAVPWLVPGFSVDTHLEGLLELQARKDRGEPLSFFAGKFLIEAKRAET